MGVEDLPVADECGGDGMPEAVQGCAGDTGLVPDPGEPVAEDLGAEATMMAESAANSHGPSPPSPSECASSRSR